MAAFQVTTEANSITSLFYGILTLWDAGPLSSNEGSFTMRLLELDGTVLYWSKGVKRVLRPIQFSNYSGRLGLLLKIKRGNRFPGNDAKLAIIMNLAPIILWVARLC